MAVCLGACGISVTVEYSETDGATGAVSGKGGTGGNGGHTGGAGGSSASGGSGGAVVNCTSSICEPAPPTGWQGFAYVVGAPNADPTPTGPTCPDGSAPTTYFTQPAGGAECAACTCGALGGVSCNVPLLCSTSDNCVGATNYTLNDGDCQGASGSPPKSCLLGTATFSGGSCPAAGGGLVSSPAFEQVAHVCVADSPGACSGGGACVTPGTNEYAGYVCIYQVGEKACPAEYSIPIVTYKKAIDTRTCSACACAANVTGCTPGSYQFFHDGLCLIGGPNLSSSTCSNFTVVPSLGFWGWKRTNAPAGIGTCAPSGGVGSGEAKGDPGQAITYCCKSP